MSLAEEGVSGHEVMFKGGRGSEGNGRERTDE